MANLKAVLTRPKINESHARNAFDRSCTIATSYQLGGLDCFFAEPFIAGSHVKLNRSIFQRTADVNTAAFPKIDTHVEFFAVPIRLLWSYWNNFKLNIQDFNSVNLGSVNASTQAFTPNSPALPFFDIHDLLKDINNVLYGASTYTPIYFPTSSTKLQDATGAHRLLGALGYGAYPRAQLYTDTDTTVFGVNPLKLLAYQKVYYDHFRNTAYETNDPSYYNIDDLFTSAQIPALRLYKLLKYRYVNYRKDYMQSVYPALNYVTSTPTGLQWAVPDTVLYQVTNYSRNFANTNTGGQTIMQSPSVSASAVPGGVVSYTSVQQVRAGFALDKLLRASAYAPKHVKDQFEARYGVKGVESGNESIRIGAYMNDVVIQEVVNTAANLGEIGGKGVGYSGFGKDIEFTCKEDCIILGLMYSMPRTSYDATCVQNWNSKLDREDFFIPEFMDMGMQPFGLSEINFFNYTGGAYVPYWNAINGTLGYKDRYSEYKLGIDRNLTLFMRNGVLSDFVVHSNLPSSSYGYGLNANYFKVKPQDMDSIFAQATDAGNMQTDKFITFIQVKCICNQNMSVHGQPSLLS